MQSHFIFCRAFFQGFHFFYQINNDGLDAHALVTWTPTAQSTKRLNTTTNKRPRYSPRRKGNQPNEGPTPLLHELAKLRQSERLRMLREEAREGANTQTRRNVRQMRSRRRQPRSHVPGGNGGRGGNGGPGSGGGGEVSRRMIPLKLAYAWTIHKSQGQTIRTKIIIGGEGKFKTHGSLYVAMSRATRVSDIGFIDGLQGSRCLALWTEEMGQRKDYEKQLDKYAEETLTKLAVIDEEDDM